MNKEFFKRNREEAIKSLDGGLLVIVGYTQMQRSNDTAFKFEQEANFWWLAGVDAPDWQLIIDGLRGKSWLVSPNLSASRQIFDGGLSPEAAKELSGVDAVISADEASSMLRQLAKKHSVAYTIGEMPHAEYLDFSLNPAQKKMHEQVSRIFNSVRDCRKELAKLRAIKQPEEIDAIKRAISLTSQAFSHVKDSLSSYKTEYEIEAEFNYLFARKNATHAYDPIVAAAGNACTLHYIDNNAPVRSRDLVLLDVGARVDGYAADITRTYAYKQVSKRAEQVHAAVQLAQKQIIDLIKPDLMVEEYQRRVDEIMKNALISINLMRSIDDEENYRKYFPHAVSHGLGVDVHDSLGAPKYLKENMILTVEPGIYIPEENIGVRIEDDILVTATGNHNLSGRLSTDL